MLDMSSIMPIFTTPSEILVFSSDFASHGATDKNTAVAAITSHLFIVTSRAVEPMPLAILRIASNARWAAMAKANWRPSGMAQTCSHTLIFVLPEWAEVGRNLQVQLLRSRS